LSSITVAVLGAGMMGQLRAKSVRENPATTLVAVADANEASAKKAAEGTSAVVFTDVATLFAKAPAVDIAIVSAPVHLHEEMVLRAFDAGAHVLCEKPLSNTVESCRRMLAAAARHGRVLATGFNHRYYPSVQFMKQAIDSGRIGAVDHLRVFGGHDGLSNFRADWMYKQPLSGGGAMMDVGIHMTDLTRFMLGEIREVYGVASERVWKVPGSEDNAVVIMKSDAGIPAFYHATWTEWKGYRFFIEAYGDRGMVRAYYAPMFNMLITQERPGGPRSRQFKFYPEIILREKFKGWQTTTYASFEQEFADFLRRLQHETTPLADGWSGLRAVEIAAAVHESTRTGTAVTLSRP
jgi:predicted dehydrogenase